MVSTNTGASMSLPTNSSVDAEELSLLVTELQELGYDAIRFASYRTAAKLRFIQTRSKFILIDIFNVIEAVRENGLNSLDPYAILTVPKIESVVTSLYVNLNKRLPFGQQVDVTSCARYLLSWMLIAYDNDGCGRGLRVFQMKVFLSTLCSGKLLDKLRYIFSQISDENGNLVLGRFSEYLQEVLALPAMVLESPTFGYTDGLASTIFTFSDGTTNNINVNCFLDAILDPGPPCICWLAVLHSMAAISSLSHGVKCSICQVNNIQGFRYKCMQCPNFNMCQNCYWQGKSAGNHLATHEVKEYSTNKSSGKSFRNSFRKSLRCVPDKSKKMPKFPEQERPLNLAHIVPPSPLPSHNGFPIYEPLDAYSDQKMFVMELGHGPPSKPSSYSDSVSESDEEHRLIARYTARLASENKYPHSRTMSQTSMSFYDTTQTQRDMIAQLEARNREIMREIARLRAQQEMEYMSGEPHGPILMEELQALRYHKSELEEKLTSLQDSRQHLMGQLEGLMKLLKAQQITPKSTPTSSPRSAKSPPMSIYTHSGSSSAPLTIHRSAPATPHHSETFTSLTGELRSAFSSSGDDFRSSSIPNTSGTYLNNAGSRSLRNDLLLAADSVTNAMSTLVKELNSGSDEENNVDGHIMKPLEFETSPDELKKAAIWKQAMDQRYEDSANFLAELRARRLSNENGVAQSHYDREDNRPDSLFEDAARANVDADTFAELYDDFNPDDFCPRLSGFPTDDESYVRTDDEESYIKTDDEGGGTDWEDGLKRWINR